MLTLNCVNCGASLEIRPGLDTFACGYCGSQQRVERRGGVVELRRVATAIKAVQRGTDRTAAELAMPRLKKELEEAEAKRASALKDADERRASAILGRRRLTAIVFLVCFIGGPFVGETLAGGSTGLARFLGVLWVFIFIAAPVFVYKMTKLPADETAAINAHFDPRVQKIRARIDANRVILDELPD